MTSLFAYDEVPYDTEANSEAHPRSMGTLARLFGIEAALPSAARVLEIGCGEGEHAIAAASYLPGARFVGFDLSGEAIARGVAVAEACGVANVALSKRDIRDVAKEPIGGRGEHDFVVAHGIYSWVPEAIRGDVLKVMRDALAPSGIAFLSVNALPGWELRRTLRALMREASADASDPAEKVAAALAIVDDLAAGASAGAGAGEGEPSFDDALAAAAAEYREHVTRATPPDAPFSRYVFHDLLADCNDPFSIDDLCARAAAAGLRVLCDTPGARPVPAVREAMRRDGAPFLQVLLCRDDARPRAEPDPGAITGMYLWADLAPAGPTGLYKTTTGAVLRAEPGSAIARAAEHAPGFVAVRELAQASEERDALARDLLEALRDGSLVVSPEPMALRGAANAERELPRVSPHVRARAAEAVERRAASSVLTSAMHRSFRVPFAELVVIRELGSAPDLANAISNATAALRDAPRELVPTALAGAIGEGGERAERAVADHVARVIERFARHGFFVGGGP